MQGVGTTRRRRGVLVVALILSLLAFLLTLVRPELQSQLWRKHEGPVLSPPNPGKAQPLWNQQSSSMAISSCCGIAVVGTAARSGSPRMDWDKYPGNPILTNACQPELVRSSGTYYLFYAWDHHLYVATSQNGLEFERHPQPILSPGVWDLQPANVAVWIEPGGLWRMLYES